MGCVGMHKTAQEKGGFVLEKSNVLVASINVTATPRIWFHPVAQPSSDAVLRRKQ